MKTSERKLWMLLVESETMSHHVSKEDILAAHYVNTEIRLQLVHDYGVNFDNMGLAARDEVFRLVEAKRKKLEAEDKKLSDSAKYLNAINRAVKKWPNGGPELSKALDAALRKYGSGKGKSAAPKVRMGT